MMARIKKNDEVMIISGSEKGKTGKVLEIVPKKGKIKVKGVGLVTRHVKARKQGDVSGIKKYEKFINISNVMPIDPVTKKPTRVGSKRLETGKRVRVSSRSKENF